ncbi:PAS domain-containing sensor histidine kinase [Dokdonia sp. Dokd-P16]|uniref:sensor histidine kinase n=1 Tax=Dokdonia sp. Dokd-P16 TaxID=2173169 RepID=UPI000D5438BE|nr:PAS domain-containing sensor histidine kinase [Dokdonia sp. Dokd-P16]AWH75732.1 PAS domain-containing sensor histidine kinase [Dokdonia sp. Dokd-P16]
MEFFEESIEEAFMILFEGASEGIVVVNAAQMIVATNQSARDIFGYDKKELEGKPLDTLIPMRFHKKHEGHFDKFMNHSDKREMGMGRDLYGQCKDGRQVPVEAGLNPFVLHNKHYVMALVTDITVRKNAEKELRQWANIFNESLNEIFIFDATSLRFINANVGAQENIGYTLDELTSMTPVDIKPEFTETQFREYIAPLLKGDEKKLIFKTKHERKDGSHYPVEIHLQPSNADDTNTLVAIILDITERVNYTDKLERTVIERTHQLEEALQTEKELNELKTKFLSLVSHEFKTPLSGILTSATLAGKYTKEDQQEKRVKHLTTIQNKVKYLNTIIDDFLSIERLETGKTNYSYTTFPLSKVLNEVIYDANMHLKDGQHIKYPTDADEYIINFDEKIMELVLSNLLYNAIKYSSEGTIVDIQLTKQSSGLEIKIIDQGIGIPEHEQKFIFNRYFRAENALLNAGTGIGLNIVKTHLENLGASISFISELDKGSTFTVLIPIS